MPISEIFEEKIQVPKNKIGLWDVLENCERQGSLDIHIKKKKENDFIFI
jgi:G:T/U-mismatch repair DNA glycosylase